MIAAVGPPARDGERAPNMEMAIGIVLVIIAALEIVWITRTAASNAPR